MTFKAGRFVLTDETEMQYVTSWDTWEEAEAAFPIDKGFRLIDCETNRMWDHHSPYEWEAAAT